MDRNDGHTLRKNLLAKIGLSSEEGSLGEAYYKDAFYTLKNIINLQALIILALVIALGFYIHSVQREDLFFAETAGERQMQMVGLDRPYLTKEAMENWISSVITEVMTFGFNDIDQRFSESRRHFTQKGWDAFYKALMAGKLISNVIDLQQIVTAVPQSQPSLIYEGFSEGRYIKMYETQVMLTFRAGAMKQNSTKIVRITVEDVPTSENPIGLGIGEWYIY